MEITTAGDVAIVDFKTGTAKEAHEQQLLLYALLWARDEVRNPKGRLATRLILQYAGQTRNVDAPNSHSLAVLEKELEHRSTAIQNALKVIPPVANVSDETCCFCDVRHLCGAYWRSGSKALQANGARTHIDCEVALQRKIGYSTWQATSLFANVTEFPKALTVHFSDSSASDGLQEGDRLRIVQTGIENADSNLPIITVRPTTEVFKVLQQD